MGRFADVQDGRVDFIGDDWVSERGWSLYRVELEEDDRSFIVRLHNGNNRLRMEIYDNLPDAVRRCVEWMA